MIRIKDPEKSKDFYENKLGMKLLTRLDFPSLTFSLYFFAYTQDTPPSMEQSQTQRAQWLWNVPYPTLELTHNWGTEKDPHFCYHNGNKEPKGFGYIGFIVDDVHQAVEALKKHNVAVITTSESKNAPVAYVADPDGYWIQLMSRNSPTFSGEQTLIGRDPVLSHTMFRIKDPIQSQSFYENGLGMKLLCRIDYSDDKITHYYYGYTDSSIPVSFSDDKERLEFLLRTRFPKMVLEHKWGTESDNSVIYHNGNVDPRGFGHIGLTVDDIYRACENVERAGYKIVRKPGPFQDVGEIAFVADPDGYWVELIKRSSSGPEKPYSKPL
ncbi:lactoylglutathione lyase [Galdieria sulphuraria]|uniref:Lactoylglutathione lyase n=1 Tax=Galdieria sulphuraria TaxID=130081 RepID=M2W7V3_GALSU|nr:lactoylglutathione lyase [Galdieria sulphuraria]EME31901.1 lactoylglutathione lyase [Galdieria sulphuraria]|eukprot:XP_005708421.1 lactoylglutathione lyase [Galdieria sulphuraria]